MRSNLERLTPYQRCDLAVLVLLTLLVAAYLGHVLAVSTQLFHIVLVLPVALLVLTLCLLEFALRLRCPAAARGSSGDSLASVLPGMALFSGYVLSLPWLGFDLGTALFVTAYLWAYGERRWYWALAYGLVFGTGVALLFSALLPYPMPMLALPSAY